MHVATFFSEEKIQTDDQTRNAIEAKTDLRIYDTKIPEYPAFLICIKHGATCKREHYNLSRGQEFYKYRRGRNSSAK